MKDHIMSPQLTLSSLFSVLALAGLCVVTGVRDLTGHDLPAITGTDYALPHAIQAGVSPGLLAD
ncbi:hypothetical protein [Porphyrobacter sp. AAP60]|uniref:hypothetical protein n=1 Tax=Porphyrobacter sp. AAP60 TaxID=1523423 RepID=UPI0006B8BE6A|nr:hypothetical protein [Porphyrobacter sp. AAP60]KPF65614.1 hypothetical protein IP79_00230 [Porphyrobacter sp. AAP60]